MANGYIQLPEDSTGKKLRTRILIEDTETLHDEVVRLANTSDILVNPATEETLQTLAGFHYPTGADIDWSKTLTSDTTAYALFTTAPTKAYSLVIYNASDTDVYIRKTTGTTLGVLLPSGGNMNIDLGANKNVYAYCASAGKILQGFYTEIN